MGQLDKEAAELRDEAAALATQVRPYYLLTFYSTGQQAADVAQKGRACPWEALFLQFIHVMYCT